MWASVCVHVCMEGEGQGRTCVCVGGWMGVGLDRGLKKNFNPLVWMDGCLAY